MENKQQSLICYMYFDKNPEMKLISYIDINKDVSTDSFIEEVSGMNYAA
jgi:hypothetical protein